MTAAAFAASLGLLAVSHQRCGRLASRLQSLDRTARRVPSSFVPRASSSSSSSSGARVPAPVAPPCLDERSSLPSKVKVALCQLPVGEDKRLNIANARAAIEDALDLWKTQAGMLEQQGTSNTASPAVHAGRRSGNATPYGSAPRGRSSLHAPSSLMKRQPGAFTDEPENRRLSSISEGGKSTGYSQGPTARS